MDSQKSRRKFNPPLLKKLNDSNISPALNISQNSCSSGASWSLPPTQTHTVLSYCDSQVAINNGGQPEVPKSTKKFITEKHKRKYCYTHHPVDMRQRGPHPHKKEKFTMRSNVKPVDIYDYSLTQTTSKKITRTKEQIEVDKIVLQLITKTREEIQVIRLHHSKSSRLTKIHKENNYLEREE